MKIKNIFKMLKGFTLSEILIVMTIVGLISLITVPTMITSVKTHEYKTGVKKAHTVVTESFDSMKIDVDKIYETYNNVNNPPSKFRDAYAKYFGVKTGLSTNFFDSQYFPLNDTTTNVNKDLYNGGGFRARNGMIVMVGRVPIPDSEDNALIISVDINGAKRGNNQLGLDVYSFQVLPSDNILPVGARSTSNNSTSFKYEDYCKVDTTGNNLNGIACTYNAVNQAKYMEGLAESGIGTIGECIKNRASGALGCPNGVMICNEQTHKCECPSGYTRREDGTCRDANNNVLTPNGLVSCKNERNDIEFDVNKQKCVCKDRSKVPDRNNNCSNCKISGQVEDNKGDCCYAGEISEGLCPCKVDEIMCGGRCVKKCDSHKLMEAESCTCKCPEGKEDPGFGECCPSSIAIEGGEITLIKAGANDLILVQECEYDCGQGLFNKSKYECECGNGAIWGNKQCTCEDKNAEYKSDGGRGICECKEGYKQVHNKCACANGSVLDNCGCPEENGLAASTTSGKCKCKTGDGFKFSGDVNADYVCTCADPNAKMENGKCICDAEKGYTGVDGICQCDSSKHFVPNGNSCSCDIANGYLFNQAEGVCYCNGEETNGKCEQKCTNGAIWNSSAQKCECNVPRAKISSDGKSCICEVNGMYYEQAQNACVCAQGTNYDQSTDTCVLGGTSCNGRGNAHVSGEGCVCQDGTVKSSNGCACPDGFTMSEFQDGQNMTPDGVTYDLLLCNNDACGVNGGIWTSNGGVNGSCECMTGMSWDSLSCKCMGENVYYEPTENSENLVPSDYCHCSSEKLTYKKITEHSDVYGCLPENGIYDITSEDDLNDAKALMGNNSFALINDVTVSGVWTPWGTPSEPFEGSFDGQGNTITVNNDIISDGDFVGFFGFTSNGCNISNVNFVIDGDVKGKAFVGALVGYNSCEINNVSVIAKSVSGEVGLGGFVGANNGIIKFSSVENTTVHQETINAVSDETKSGIIELDNYKSNALSSSLTVEGGFVGYNKDEGLISYSKVLSGKIAESSSDGAVNKVAGGFVGENSGRIESCIVDSATVIGKVDVGSTFGGFAGAINGSGSTINYSYSQAGHIYGDEKIGGLVGSLMDGALQNCYTTTSDITAHSATYPAAGLIGVLEPVNALSLLNANGCFYNNANVDIGEKNGKDITGTIYGKDEANLKDPKNYICAKWDEGLSKDKWYYPTSSFPEIVDKTTCKNSSSFPVIEDGITKCITCGYGEYFNGNECFAFGGDPNDPNYLDCVMSKECPAGQHLDEMNNCVECDPKKIWNSETKACECPDDMTPSGATCVCSAPNSVYTNKYSTGTQKVCVPCGDVAEAVADGEGCSCVAAGKTFDYATGVCDCVAVYGYPDPKNPGQCLISSLVNWDAETETATCKSESATYEILSKNDMLILKNCANGTAGWTRGKTFKLANDIMMLKEDNVTPEEYTPINTFEGTFNGNNKIISYLTINLPTVDNVGLFGTVSNANAAVTIQNVKLSNFNITGKNNVGAIAGILSRTTGNTITFSGNTLSDGTVSGTEYVGGLIGYANIANSLNLSNVNTVGTSAVPINVSVTGSNAGGFAGYLNNTASLNIRRQKSYVSINGSAIAFCAPNSGKAGLFGFVSNTANLTLGTGNTYKNVSNMATLYCPAP